MASDPEFEGSSEAIVIANLQGTSPISVRAGRGRVATVRFDDRGRCLEVTLRANGRELRPPDLRLAWGRVIEAARQQRRASMSKTLDEADAYLGTHGIDAATSKHQLAQAIHHRDVHLDAEAVRRRPRKGHPQKLPGFYLDVAKEYAKYVDERSPKPTAMVALWARTSRHRERGATPNRAAQWVMTARKMGYLTPAPAGQRGGGRLTSKAKNELRRTVLAHRDS